MNKKRMIILLLILFAVFIGIWFICVFQIQKDDSIAEDVSVKNEVVENKTEKPKQDVLLSDKKGTEDNTSGSDVAEEKEKEQKPDDKTPSQKEEKPQSEKSGHYEKRQELLREAWDEKVLVKKGTCTDVLVQEAYDSEEMVYLDGAFYGPDTQEGYVCNGCGAVFFDASINDHIGSPEHPGWHNELIATSDPYWHNVEYRTVHHDAVYQTECEEDEYEIIHHDAEYKTVLVWVED